MLHHYELIFRWIDMQLIPVILCGEVGTHPKSISEKKQPQPSRLPPNTYTSLQKSILRGALLPAVKKIVVVTPREAFFDIKDEMQQIHLTAQQTTSFIVEPFRRNTAASVATAVLHIAQLHSEDALVLVLKAEHLPIDQDVFQKTILAAIESALSDKLIVFGMRTYQANTKYSWDKASNNKASQASFQWNSGLFLFKAGSMLKAMREHCPDVLSTTFTCLKHSELIEEQNLQKLELNPSTFCNVPEGSLNDIVIKKSNKTTVMLCDLNWLDLESFTS